MCSEHSIELLTFTAGQSCSRLLFQSTTDTSSSSPVRGMGEKGEVKKPCRNLDCSGAVLKPCQKGLAYDLSASHSGQSEKPDFTAPLILIQKPEKVKNSIGQLKGKQKLKR